MPTSSLRLVAKHAATAPWSMLRRKSAEPRRGVIASAEDISTSCG
ncbi:hypothetical protein ACI2LC_06275 [Nonomuraea wenchangensis]